MEQPYIPSNQLYAVECTNKDCHSTIFYQVVPDNTDPIYTNFENSQCPYCGKYSLTKARW